MKYAPLQRRIKRLSNEKSMRREMIFVLFTRFLAFLTNRLHETRTLAPYLCANVRRRSADLSFRTWRNASAHDHTEKATDVRAARTESGLDVLLELASSCVSRKMLSITCRVSSARPQVCLRIESFILQIAKASIRMNLEHSR